MNTTNQALTHNHNYAKSIKNVPSAVKSISATIKKINALAKSVHGFHTAPEPNKYHTTRHLLDNYPSPTAA